MTEQGLTTIIHRDRHGKHINERALSVPLVHDIDGESMVDAVSQKGVRDAINGVSSAVDANAQILAEHEQTLEGLQGQIDSIIAGNSSQSLAPSPDTIFAGEVNVIKLTARCTPQADSITIKQGASVVANGTDMASLIGNYTADRPTSNIPFTADFVVSGNERHASCTVTVVHPIYYGSSKSASPEITSLTRLTSAKKSPAGTYNINVTENESFVFFAVPSPMQIKTSIMGVLEFPLESPTSRIVNGISYNVYRSSNEYDAERLTIVLT